MAKSIKLSDTLINDAEDHGKAMHRSATKQIEYWARIGKIAEENKDLPFSLILDLLATQEEEDSENLAEYKYL